MRVFANVVIISVTDLKHTDDILGSVLDLNFTKDTSGYYEEYPTYEAEKFGLYYALLGNEETNYNTQNQQENEYSLIVRPAETILESSNTYISGEIASLISKDGRLSCRPLPDPDFSSLEEP